MPCELPSGANGVFGGMVNGMMNPYNWGKSIDGYGEDYYGELTGDRNGGNGQRQGSGRGARGGKELISHQRLIHCPLIDMPHVTISN